MSDAVIKADTVCPIFTHPWSMTIAPGAITNGAEEHAVEINYTGTVGASSGMVALNVTATVAGLAGAWACGIYAKVVESATKRISGYFCAAEFELNTADTNPSAMACIVLDGVCSHLSAGEGFIHIRDYGSAPLRSLFYFGAEITAGSGSATKLISTSGTPRTITHTIRCTALGAPLWIQCSTTAP